MAAPGTTDRKRRHVSADALLEALLDTTDDAVVGSDERGHVTVWNEAAGRYFGFAGTEIAGTPVVALFPDHLRGDVGHVLESVLAGDRVRRFESEILRKDGMPMPVAISVSPVLAGDAAPVAAVLVVRDITEQRLDQAALGEFEVRVRESEALAHVGSWLWDVRTGAVQWSDEFHRIHGVDPLDFDGTYDGHLSVIHVDDRDRVRAAMESSLADRRVFDAEYRVVRPDGEVRLVHVRAQPTVGSAGTALGLRGIGQDVSEVRAAG
jgi:PAS domain S-box-containing protein